MLMPLLLTLLPCDTACRCYAARYADAAAAAAPTPRFERLRCRLLMFARSAMMA